MLSFAALRELNEVLSRRQFRKYVDEDDIHRFLASLVRQAMWVEVSAKITACRDPNDDKFLELAVSGLATHIVTGDQDLLAGARPVSGDKHPDASRLSRPAPASTPKVLSRVVPSAR